MSEEKNFESLALRGELLEGLAALEYRKMTVIQEASLPPIWKAAMWLGARRPAAVKPPPLRWVH